MIRYRYSRLGKLQERQTKAQIALLTIVAILALVGIIKFGIPALFSLTTALTSLRQTPSKTVDENALEIPPVPSLEAQYSATSSASVKLSGRSDPRVTILIARNGQPGTSVLTSDDGSFDYLADLTPGSNIFTAQTVSASGKKSELSDQITVVNLTGNPKLEIEVPTEGQTFSGQDSLQISGKTDAGDSVTINESNAIVGSDGAFKYFYRLKSGDNLLVIVATDPAGNSTKKELTVKLN